MRDPKRITPFLDMLEQLWLLYPDMRFGQIVTYLESFLPSEDSFYTEEPLWLMAIERGIKEKT